MNRIEWNVALAKRGATVRSLAREMGITKTALYNKIGGRAKFSIEDIRTLREIMALTDEEVLAIFEL